MYKRKELKKISNTLDKEIINLINEQIWLENNASFYYLYLSTQFNLNGFSGISKFFLDQSNEEREHMLKLVEYLMDEDITPQIPNYNYLEDLDEKFDLLNHFENSLLNEKRVSSSINEIITKCKEKNDIKTENFMQWFVIEQREEENKFKSIIDDIRIIGKSGSGLYELNKQLGSITEEE